MTRDHQKEVQGAPELVSLRGVTMVHELMKMMVKQMKIEFGRWTMKKQVMTKRGRGQEGKTTWRCQQMQVLCFSLYYTFTPLSLDSFYHYLITLLQGHMAKHAITL